MSDVETYRFADDGRFPNSALPLLVYRGALPPDPAAMERAFAANGWSNSWRDGIFDYHHFHSIAHEVLGIASGEVRVAFGGPSGQEVTVRAGDVVAIPAGVAHRNMGASADLLAVGAYPGGGDYDIRRGDPAEHAAALRAIAAVQLPDSDPVSGQGGFLRRLWAPD
ncbi:MAG TPA: cupin domain-containing protein [Acetobacteraceae bacterium]|nr:cupin domain-containing protein [Acetobacteraceae bacterium]